MRKALLFAVPLLWFLAGCAGQVALVNKAEWERRQAEIAALKAELAQIRAQQDLHNRENAQQLGVLKADLQMTLADVKANVNALSGKLEENRYDLQKISKTTEKLSERKYVLKGGGVDSLGRPLAPDSVLVEDKVDVQKLLQIARKDFNSRDYDRARKEFDDIVAKFPLDPLADDALYWAGECDYVRKKYAEAIAIYKRLAKDYPEGDMLPSALYKAGLSYQKLNDNENMKRAWNDLILKFPYSDEAMQAKARLGQ